MAVTKYQPQLTTVYMGLTADTKPTNVAVGSKYVATDTPWGVFLFTNAGTWVQIGVLGASNAVTAIL
jgi:hypothetical protein